MRKLICSVVLLAAASQANAVCTQGSMAGNWQLYYQDYFCTLSLANDGRVKSGNCTFQDRPNSGENIVYPITGGRVNMKGNCRIGGNLNLTVVNPFADPEPFQLKITQSRTRRDTQYWNGAIWHNRREQADTFHAVRVGRHN